MPTFIVEALVTSRRWYQISAATAEAAEAAVRRQTQDFTQEQEHEVRIVDCSPAKLKGANEDDNA